MNTKIKDADIQIKAGPDDGLAEGEFTAYASVFGNVDSYGDVVQPGAFADTLAEWKSSGAPIPLLWGHNMTDPDYNIGHLTDAVEDDHGLLITGQLDMDAPKSAQVYRLLKGRRVRQMSFAYDVIEGKKNDTGGLDLEQLRLHEASIVPIGANQETEILAVKAATELAAQAKEGRVLAAKHIDSLRKAQEAIGAVIAAAEGSNDQDKASEAGPVKDDSPDQAKSDEPSRASSVDAWTARINLTELEYAQ